MLKSLLRRLRGALGVIAASAVGFTGVAWIVTVITTLGRGSGFGGWAMALDFTLAMLTGGAILGSIVALAIAVSASRFREVTSGSAFLGGVLVGGALTLVINLLAGTAIPIRWTLLNAAIVGAAAGVAGYVLVGIASHAPELEVPSGAGELPQPSEGTPV